jgi:hypothetical protein
MVLFTVYSEYTQTETEHKMIQMLQMRPDVRSMRQEEILQTVAY